MDYATQANIYQIIVESLKELGISDAEFSITDTTQPDSGRVLRRPEPCLWTRSSHYALGWRAD